MTPYDDAPGAVGGGRPWLGTAVAISGALLLVAAVACARLSREGGAAGVPLTDGYRTPSGAVVRLLTGGPPPEPLLHADSKRVALLYREPVIELERLARPRLGLAGYRFDPWTRTSGVGPLVARVEVVQLAESSAGAVVEWRPQGGARLDDVRFAPDGRTLSALAVARGPARLVLFDVETGSERALDVPVNPAWGEPCQWLAPDSLLCRVLPADLPPTPSERIEPGVVEHRGGAAPTRTWSNLLESAYEESLFEHYFAVELARVSVAGELTRLPVARCGPTDQTVRRSRWKDASSWPAMGAAPTDRARSSMFWICARGRRSGSSRRIPACSRW